MEIFIGEAIGTFVFVFFTLAIISNVISLDKGNVMSVFAISIGIGIAYLVPCILFSDLTGAHFNIAVTASVFLLGILDIKLIGYYISAQVLGSIVASFLYAVCFRSNLKKCRDEDLKVKLYAVAPTSKNNILNFIKETAVSYIFMFMILLITFVVKDLSKGEVYILMFLVIALLGMAFNYTVVAFNPLRDIFTRLLFAPRDIKSQISKVYVAVTILAPILGTVLATLTYKIIPWDKIM